VTTILGAAVSGIQHSSNVIDTVAHNLANASTAGFRKTRALGEGTPATAGEPGTPRLGVALTTYDVVQAPGSPLASENALHFTITDDAFFRVRDAAGGVVFTRAGALGVDAAGNVTAGDGLLLEPPLAVPAGFTSPAIDETGMVSALDGTGAREAVGRLSFVRFTNPAALEQLGSGLYGQTVNSGAPVDVMPGAGSVAALLPGTLESSNVDLAEEFTTMLIAQRAYQANVKAFSVGDQMLAIATKLTA
jgi:flagellar hook protein FlgE